MEAILGEESDDSDFEVECIESLLSLFNRAFSFELTLRWQPRQNEKTEFLIELTNLEECSFLLTLTLLDKIHDWQFTFLYTSSLINILIPLQTSFNKSLFHNNKAWIFFV